MYNEPIGSGKTVPYRVIFSLGLFNVTNEQTSKIFSEENGRKNVDKTLHMFLFQKINILNAGRYSRCWIQVNKVLWWLFLVADLKGTRSIFPTFLLFVIAARLRLKRAAIRYSVFLFESNKPAQPYCTNFFSYDVVQFEEIIGKSDSAKLEWAYFRRLHPWSFHVAVSSLFCCPSIFLLGELTSPFLGIFTYRDVSGYYVLHSWWLIAYFVGLRQMVLSMLFVDIYCVHCFHFAVLLILCTLFSWSRTTLSIYANIGGVIYEYRIILINQKREIAWKFIGMCFVWSSRNW